MSCSGPPSEQQVRILPVLGVGDVGLFEQAIAVHADEEVSDVLLKRQLRGLPALSMGIRRKQITPYSPWQNGVAERWVETVRRHGLHHRYEWRQAA